METASIHFPLRPRARRDRALHAIHNYLGALWRNGQALNAEKPIARARGGYAVFLSLPAADALEPQHANGQVRRARRALAAAGISSPRVRRLGPDPDGRSECRCRRRSFLILFTSFLHLDSPIRCGECFDPVPLYVLPTTGDAGDYHDILWWKDTYQAMDWLWIGSGAGERFGHEQKARHDSPLSKDGREVAKTMERRARLPVYYHLDKFLARSSRSERARRCPSCGRAWRLEQPLHRIFDFKCDRCRLVSNLAWDVRELPGRSA